MKLTINKQILLGYGVIIILVVVVVGQFFITRFENITELNKRIVDEIMPAKSLFNDVSSALHEAEKTQIQLNLIKSSVYVERLKADLNKVVVLSGQFKIKNPFNEINPMFRSFEKLITDYRKDMSEVSQKTRARGRDFLVSNEYNNYQIRFSEYLSKASQQKKEIEKIFVSLISQEKEDIVKSQGEALRILLIMFAGLVLVSLLIGLVTTRRVSSNIFKISDLLNSASEEILNTAEEEEEKSELQSVSLNQTTLSLKDLSEEADKIAKNASEVTREVERTSGEMRNLSEKTGLIVKITTAIEEISQQINILSLNASIEAARAGEQGKGFSVVAMEIRKLAENTRKQTDDITKLIREIQTAVTNTKEAANAAVDSVIKIDTSVKEQTSATTQISQTVSHINNDMKKSLEAIQKTVKAAENLNDIADKLHKMI